MKASMRIWWLLAFIFVMTTISSCGKNDVPKVEMVDVVNKPYSEALTILEEVGFTNITSNVTSDRDVSQWIVTDQHIAPGKAISPDEKIELVCSYKCLLYLDISSESNLLFNTYDIAISLNSKEIGSVSNGNTLTYLADVFSGDNTLLFCKSGSSSPSVTKVISVSGDMTYSCELAHSGSSIKINNEATEEGTKGAGLSVVDVTGKVLSDAMAELYEIGFSNVREEPYGSIWDKDNWIVTAQSVNPDSIVDKNTFIQLDCITLDSYFAEVFVGKNVNEILDFLPGTSISVVFQDEYYSDISSQVISMDQETKAKWVASSAVQALFQENTAIVTIKNTSQNIAIEQKEKETTSTEEIKYDIDKDLIVSECKRDTQKDTMYHIAFTESDSSGNVLKVYTFSSIINPRAMGKQFNAIGELPLWFYEGATVHVKANLVGNELSEVDCEVTPPTGTAGGDEGNLQMPTMAGTNLDTVISVAAQYGLSRSFDDVDLGDGTAACALESSNGGITLDVVYSVETKEILTGGVVTFNNLSTEAEQIEFIRGIAKVLCPQADVDDVTNWVDENVGKKEKTTINSFVYEVGLGPVGNALYNAGNDNWEEWTLQVSKGQ